MKSSLTVGGQYRLVRKIGSGSFGDIYLGIDKNNDDEVRKIYRIVLTIDQYLYEFGQLIIKHF